MLENTESTNDINGSAEIFTLSAISGGHLISLRKSVNSSLVDSRVVNGDRKIVFRTSCYIEEYEQSISNSTINFNVWTTVFISVEGTLFQNCSASAANSNTTIVINGEEQVIYGMAVPVAATRYIE